MNRLEIELGMGGQKTLHIVKYPHPIIRAAYEWLDEMSRHRLCNTRFYSWLDRGMEEIITTPITDDQAYAIAKAWGDDE